MNIKKVGFSLLFVIIFLLSITSSTYAVKCSWDEVTGASWYNVYISTTHDKAFNKVGDIATLTTFSTFICHDIPYYSVIFVGVTAVDSRGYETEVSNIPYILKGNIAGTYEEGVPYTDARVDENDLTVLGAHWGQSASHLTYECSYFHIGPEIPTQLQSADLNKDGRVDGFDYFILIVNYGKTAN
ncbi:hydrolase of the metallo-beta-lactamase superfamily [Candidatus Scalindua japonica]|uniref:Hydrolase of the metallo-beta-lactamase superfamily n=1 Tax=Candidatus Scalindua japonica TaxID=1284222 RepID=A0A286TV27_9BACT|nr:dockerin type I domain-containing protein [Candidatus Scalindua japonica]GAX59757.1 hydrolase of the metallo-beta-lactamase superfamily [Candidatus Scalindua japonica]